MQKIILVTALLLSLSALPHHPDGPEPHPDFAVVARIHVAPSELPAIRESHLLLGYLWRNQIAVVLADRRLLGANARIDWEATQRLGTTSARPQGVSGFPCYRTVEETQADLKSLAQRAPTLAEWVDYGDSWEKINAGGGYDLGALALTNRAAVQPANEPKPVLMIMAAMHARELTTAETATRFAEYLINGYGSDADITWILDHTAIHILPQHNPDGRKQAEAGFLWRKNTNEAYCSPTSTSRGADLNRNASTLFWGQASNNQCGETYQGPTPASEPETSSLEQYQIDVFPDQRDGGTEVGAPNDASGLFISLHSWGEYVFYPWEGADLDTGNESGYRSLSQRLGSITGYAACQNCCLGTAAGTAVDFAYEAFGVASLTFELGTSFFEECAPFEDQIWPDNRDALLYAAKAARRPYQSSHGPVISDIEVVVDEASETAQLTATIDDGAYAVNKACPPFDPVQASDAIASASWTVDTPPWDIAGVTLAPEDGAFDSPVESATASMSLADLGSGRHLVFLQAVDESGNQGPPSAIFVQIPVLFADSFETNANGTLPTAPVADGP